MNDDINKIKKFTSYSQSKKKIDTTLSEHIWKNAIKDFNLDNSTSLRGYGINSQHNQKKINTFYKYQKIINFPFRKYREIVEKYFLKSKLINFFNNRLIRLLSFIVFKDSKISSIYGFDYPEYIYKTYYKYNNIESEYKKFNETNSLYFSHNSFKSFTYFSEFKKL